MKFISIQTIEEKTEHAIVKARSDANQIIQSSGYHPIIFGSTSPIGFYRVIKRHYDILSLKFLLKKEDVVFFQFPWIHNNKPNFYHNLFASGAKINCLIHDLDSFRYSTSTHNDEIEVLKKCNMIIAHTPAMKDFLVEHGVEADRIKILYLFDYLTDDSFQTFTSKKQSIIVAFAGNLKKSIFLTRLHEISSDHLEFYLYGKGYENEAEQKHVQYKGIFKPENVAFIEGDWGLVWDGENLETCKGVFGEYLKYNSSHKISLYVAAGMPVIIWEQSSLKDYIIQNHLGIAVDSLYNLENRIKNLPTKEIDRIKICVRKYAEKIRKGNNLSSLIRAKNS